MIHNENRIGHFTSSNIWKLLTLAKDGVSFGAPALGYIEEKRMERRLGKSIEKGATSRDMSWGQFMEIVVFELLDLSYDLTSKATDLHPKYGDIWAGSKDLIVPGVKIADIKAFQYKKFCLYADCLMQKDINLFRTTFPEEYWQLVSNACINKVRRAEAILFMPYESQLPEIQKLAHLYDGEGWQYYKFIADADPKDLPSLKDNGYYSNITSFEFEVPADDVVLLTKKVIEAGKLLTAA